MAWWKKGCLTVVLGLVLLVLAFWLVYGGAKEQLDGEIARVALAPEHVAARAEQTGEAYARDLIVPEAVRGSKARKGILTRCHQ